MNKKKNMAADTIDFKSYLDMSIEFFTAPEIIAKAKKGRKICGLTFPLSELIIAGGAVPVFIPRLNKGRRYDVIQTTLQARNLLGMGNITKGLDFLKKVDSSGTVLNIAGNLINDIIESLNETYEDAVTESAELGMPIDHCYGAKALFGLYNKLGHLLDMNLGIDVRCSVFFNYHEALTINKLVPNNYIFDMPYEDDQNSINFYVEEINDYIEFQERVSGKRFSIDRFRNVLELTNEAKRLLKEFYLGPISKGDILPCSPATFSEMNSLLLYSQIDYNSRLQLYVSQLKALIQECYDRIDSTSKRFDATGYPKLIYTPIFGGFEPAIAIMADGFGARVYYPDWVIYGACEEVSTKGDIIQNYAENIMTFQHGFAFTNKEMANNVINVAKKIDADGIVFCEIFGCRAMSACNRILKDLTRKNDTNIPVTTITYERMAKGLGQVKTRLGAFIEMIKS